MTGGIAKSLFNSSLKLAMIVLARGLTFIEFLTIKLGRREGLYDSRAKWHKIEDATMVSTRRYLI